jgi:nucleoside-diphosphate-sugar epimerase
LVSGKHGGKDCPETGFPVYVHIEDVGVAHVNAFEKPVAKNNRYMLVSPSSFLMFLCVFTDVRTRVKVAGMFFNPDMVEILHRHFPQHAARFPKRQPDFKRPSNYFSVDSSKAKNQLLGRDFISFEQTVVDTANRLFELEKKLQAK